MQFGVQTQLMYDNTGFRWWEQRGDLVGITLAMTPMLAKAMARAY